MEAAGGIAVDPAGSLRDGIHRHAGSGFPGTAGSQIQSTLGGALDAFVTKVNATGTALVYMTPSWAAVAMTKASGSPWTLQSNAYVTGLTGTPGSGFPGTADSLVQSTYGGGGDAFVTKLNATGSSLVYSTYLGGSGDDREPRGDRRGPRGQCLCHRHTLSPPGSGFPDTAGSQIQRTCRRAATDSSRNSMPAGYRARLFDLSGRQCR